MRNRTFEFQKPTGAIKDTNIIMRISQFIGGAWAHLIDVNVVNTGDLSVDLTETDKEELLKQMTDTIYQCEKLQLGADNRAVVFYPQHGPVQIELMEKPEICS